jgi:hypothetical protein
MFFRFVTGALSVTSVVDLADDEAGDGGKHENGPIHLRGMFFAAALAGAGMLESASAGRVVPPPYGGGARGMAPAPPWPKGAATAAALVMGMEGAGMEDGGLEYLTKRTICPNK